MILTFCLFFSSGGGCNIFKAGGFSRERPNQTLCPFGCEWTRSVWPQIVPETSVAPKKQKKWSYNSTPWATRTDHAFFCSRFIFRLYQLFFIYFATEICCNHSWRSGHPKTSSVSWFALRGGDDSLRKWSMKWHELGADNKTVFLLQFCIWSLQL